MGNTTGKEKGRHSSGEDTGPMMSTDQVFDVYSSSLDESGEFPRGAFKSLGRESDMEPITRMRASTITPGTEINERKLPTVFKWEGGGKNVFISGSFDNWKTKIPMVRSHGDFYTIIDLNEGTHQYKFLVDGQWNCDPMEKKIQTDQGLENNEVHVKSSDFEVFEALAMDDISVAEKGTAGSPPGEYSQDIPPRNHELGFHHSGPPILPPHLLQVILKKKKVPTATLR